MITKEELHWMKSNAGQAHIRRLGTTYALHKPTEDRQYIELHRLCEGGVFGFNLFEFDRWNEEHRNWFDKAYWWIDNRQATFWEAFRGTPKIEPVACRYPGIDSANRSAIIHWAEDVLWDVDGHSDSLHPPVPALL